jgi:hypothetical protein
VWTRGFTLVRQGHSSGACSDMAWPDWSSCSLPDGSRRVLTGGGTGNVRSRREYYALRLWNTKTGDELACLNGHTADVTCLVISANGRAARGRHAGLLRGRGQFAVRIVTGHRAMGLILPEHRDGMPEGWEHRRIAWTRSPWRWRRPSGGRAGGRKRLQPLAETETISRKLPVQQLQKAKPLMASFEYGVAGYLPPGGRLSCRA